MAEESFVRVGGDGQQVEVTDPIEIAEVEAARESITNFEDKRVNDAADVLAAFSPKAEVDVEEVEIFFREERVKVNVKKLGYRDLARLDAKKYRRKANGELTADAEHAATTGLAWQIADTIVVNSNRGKTGDDGEELKPKWVPLYPLPKVLELMESSDPDAKDLIYSLLGAVWQVNVEISVGAQAQAANFLSGQ